MKRVTGRSAETEASWRRSEGTTNMEARSANVPCVRVNCLGKGEVEMRLTVSRHRGRGRGAVGLGPEPRRPRNGVRSADGERV